MKIGGLLTLLFALALPLPLAAQDDRRADRPPLPGPVEVLLTNRTQLGLTAAQVARLEQIEREMEEANRAPVMRLIELRREGRAVRGPRGSREGELTDAQRQALGKLMEEARPLLAQIRVSNRAAMGKVGAVLTPEQKTQLRGLIQARANRDGGRRGSTGRTAGPR